MAMQATNIGMFDDVDRRLADLARAAATPRMDLQANGRGPSATKAVAKPVAKTLPLRLAPALAPALPVDLRAPIERSSPRPALPVLCMLVAAVGFFLIAAADLFWPAAPLTGKAAIDAVVARMIDAESRGALDFKNKRSSAAGPAQFLDETWLELLRTYRPDLMKQRTRDEVLALRGDRGLAREIATRFAERNAALLKRHDLPVTAGTLYLAHFAGPAGAAALLKAPDNADAAAVMAKADASGNTKREQIVKANPFLDKFTVADIRRWADRKMEGPAVILTTLLSGYGTQVISGLPRPRAISRTARSGGKLKSHPVPAEALAKFG
jgi:hypothetical protein